MFYVVVTLCLGRVLLVLLGAPPSALGSPAHGELLPLPSGHLPPSLVGGTALHPPWKVGPLLSQGRATRVY